MVKKKNFFNFAKNIYTVAKLSGDVTCDLIYAKHISFSWFNIHLELPYLGRAKKKSILENVIGAKYFFETWALNIPMLLSPHCRILYERMANYEFCEHNPLFLVFILLLKLRKNFCVF